MVAGVGLASGRLLPQAPHSRVASSDTRTERVRRIVVLCVRVMTRDFAGDGSEGRPEHAAGSAAAVSRVRHPARARMTHSVRSWAREADGPAAQGDGSCGTWGRLRNGERMSGGWAG